MVVRIEDKGGPQRALQEQASVDRQAAHITSCGRLGFSWICEEREQKLPVRPVKLNESNAPASIIEGDVCVNGGLQQCAEELGLFPSVRDLFF